MATTWDPAHAGNIIFSNGNLTLKGNANAAIAYATTGIPANDSGDHIFTVTCTAIGFGSTDCGLIIAGQSVTARPDRYNPAAPIDVMDFMSSGGNVFDNVWTTLASPTGNGVNVAAGGVIEVRMKNGFLYWRYKPPAGAFGAYNGTTGTYANANPATDTGGIPLSPFGSALLYPYLYIEGDTYTADFTNWSVGTTLAGAGSAAGSGVGTGRSAQSQTISGAGNAAGIGTASGKRNQAFTITPRNDQLIFHVKTGLGIAYPFLYPTGNDTGNASTSSYSSNPYVVPTDFASHVGNWLTTTAVAQGFDHIRLQVNPGPIIESQNLNQPARKASLLSQIAAAVDYILAAGLKCIIDLHLTGFPTGYANSDYLDGINGPQFAKYQQMLADVAGKFTTYDPRLVAIELMNEPPSSTTTTTVITPTIPANAIQVPNASTLYSTLAAGVASAGGKTYVLAAGSYGAFYFPGVDFSSNPIRIICQPGVIFDIVGFGGAGGIQLENAKATGANGQGQCFSVGGCTNVTLLNPICDTGSPDGTQVGQGIQVRNASNIIIQGRADASIIDITGCGNAVGVVAPNSNVLITGLTIRNNGVDGILVGSAGTDVNDRITIDGNLGYDFFSDIAGGDHPDWIQFFGNYTSCVVRNNGWYRGIGNEAQGYFFENPTNLLIQYNWTEGGMYNGIAVSAGHTVQIDSNYVVGDPTYGPWIIVRGATDRATLTNNYACSITNYASDGVNTNFVPATLPGTNHIIPAVALTDFVGLDAWIATIPTTRRRTPTGGSGGSTPITGYANMIKAMHTTVRSIMPNHTIIATAGGYNTPSILKTFDPSAYDKNTIWAFHWYPLSSVQGLAKGGLS